jgi:hypothetical protein
MLQADSNQIISQSGHHLPTMRCAAPCADALSVVSSALTWCKLQVVTCTV